jgi:hormone-sensitive lipase
MILSKSFFTKYRKYVQIRVLSEHKLNVNFKTGKLKADENTNIKTVIIHIHGGGFISLSSRVHQTYLRKWTKLVPNSIVFSIDYRLSPEYVFPAALDDIWQGYYWLLTQCKTQLGIPLDNIFVAGDSAGGNFSMTLTLRALHANVRLPDAVILGYPGKFTFNSLALNLSMKGFTPSMLVAIDDYMLRYNFLLVCINSYVKDGDPEVNPFISPIKIKDEV